MPRSLSPSIHTRPLARGRTGPLRSLAGVIVLLAVLAAWPALAVACWTPPVEATVTDHFRPPACRWCPGNRGMTYATARGATIVAVAAGEVVFAGSVAGTPYVVVRLGDGRRITYGNVVPGVLVGELVVAGITIGAAAGEFHLGLREGERYVDPEPLIGVWRRDPWLLPIDGEGVDPPPRRLRCQAGVNRIGSR